MALQAIGAGLALAGSLPPWGWWPLAFVGIALLDGLIADQPWPTRFARTWLVAAAWLYPAMLWMWDLTAPGYLVAGAFYACFFAVAAALTPAGPERRLILPLTFALAELARWSWPFGGVPLAHLAMTQVNTPIVQMARLGGSLLVVVAVVIIGQAVTALAKGQNRTAAIGVAVVAVAVGAFLIVDLLAGVALSLSAEVLRRERRRAEDKQSGQEDESFHNAACQDERVRN